MADTDNENAAFDNVGGATEIEALFVQNAAASAYDGDCLTLSVRVGLSATWAGGD